MKRVHPIVTALKQAREQRGWSQVALANRIHKTPQAVHQFETADGDRLLRTIEDVATALGMRLVLVPAEEQVGETP